MEKTLSREEVEQLRIGLNDPKIKEDMPFGTQRIAESYLALYDENEKMKAVIEKLKEGIECDIAEIGGNGDGDGR